MCFLVMLIDVWFTLIEYATQNSGNVNSTEAGQHTHTHTKFGLRDQYELLVFSSAYSPVLRLHDTKWKSYFVCAFAQSFRAGLWLNRARLPPEELIAQLWQGRRTLAVKFLLSAFFTPRLFSLRGFHLLFLILFRVFPLCPSFFHSFFFPHRSSVAHNANGSVARWMMNFSLVVHDFSWLNINLFAALLCPDSTGDATLLFTLHE